jgi:hypothetical protein
MTLVLGDTIAVLDIFLPAFDVSHDVDENGEPGHVIDEKLRWFLVTPLQYLISPSQHSMYPTTSMKMASQACRR